PIESANDRCFGLFHFKADTAVQVKNVVLRGSWGNSFTAADQRGLLALNVGRSTPALARAQHSLVGEKYLSTSAYDVWKQAQEMAPIDRYAFLRNWVLPGDLHPTLRLDADWTPADSASDLRAQASQPSQKSPTRVHSGAELVSPALELVAVAKELGKLDELATAAAIAGKEHPELDRPLTSFNVLLALARRDQQVV